MPKSSKRFIIHTESLNSQGFRMLTDGAILTDFEKNPVLLFNHIRPEGNAKNQILPIGYWEDIEVKDGQISAVPFFDDADEFAMSIYNKVESGVIKMASIGAEPLETSTEKNVLVAGQKLATVTKWVAKEASICDIGANPDALAVALYDSDSKQISLSQGTIPSIISSTKSNMNKGPKAVAPAAKSKGVKLADEPQKEELADDDPEKALADDDGDEKDKEIASLKAKLAELEEKLKQALAEDDPEKELADEDTKETKLAAAALKMGKIRLSEVSAVIQLAKGDYEGTVAMLKNKKAEPTVKSALDLAALSGTNLDENRIVELSKKSFDELFKSGDLEFVKLNAPEVYKAKYKSKFNKEPKEA